MHCFESGWTEFLQPNAAVGRRVEFQVVPQLHVSKDQYLFPAYNCVPIAPDGLSLHLETRSSNKVKIHKFQNID